MDAEFRAYFHPKFSVEAKRWFIPEGWEFHFRETASRLEGNSYFAQYRRGPITVELEWEPEGHTSGPGWLTISWLRKDERVVMQKFCIGVDVVNADVAEFVEKLPDYFEPRLSD